MLFQSSEAASTMLCLLVSAVPETCEFGSEKSLQRHFLALKRSPFVQFGNEKFTSKQGE